MSPQLFRNNAASTLAVAIDADDTSVTVATGDGALFPAPTFGEWAVVTLEEWDKSNPSEWVLIAREIVSVTARSGDVLTVVRGQEGTTPASFTTAATVEARLTAGAFDAVARTDAENTFAGAQEVAVGLYAEGIKVHLPGDMFSLQSVGYVAFGDSTGVSDMAMYRLDAGVMVIEADNVNVNATTFTKGDVAVVVTNDTRLSDARTPLAHTHVATDISNSTATGRSLLTAADAAAARTVTGAAAASHTHGVTDLTATGTRDATTYLRGDNTWATPAGGSAPLVNKSTATQTIGTTATEITGTSVALAAATRYRFRVIMSYRNGTTTAVHAFRTTYSGTLNTGVAGSNVANTWGTNGAPGVWAAAGRSNTLAINGTMPTTTGGIGNTGSTTADAQAEISGTILTTTAGNLAVAAVSSANNGLVLHHVVIEVWETP